MEHLAHCPPTPGEFTTLVPPPPPLGPGESWVDHLNLYVTAFFEQRDRDKRAAAWQAAHPGC